MIRVWMYSIAASKDPDKIHCVVPWRVDEKLIFFGPCKKRMRERLRKEYLGSSTSHSAVSDQIFVVGVNGGNPGFERKVVWWGRISEVMTFYEADTRLKGKRFDNLRNHPDSPLHVRPIIENELFVGYEHVSNEHIKNNDWIADLTSTASPKHIRIVGRKITIQDGTAWKVYDRDCCIVLENRFFSDGEGIEFDEIALDILRDAQPGKSRNEIDDYAVFGLTKKTCKKGKQANGLRGTYLEMAGSVADRFIAWLEGNTLNITISEKAGNHGTSKTRCS